MVAVSLKHFPHGTRRVLYIYIYIYIYTYMYVMRQGYNDHVTRAVRRLVF